MCTAVTYKTADFYFGRTLDYDFSYDECITITPRKFPFRFRNSEQLNSHYAIIGMAYVLNDYPLYYDAMNEKGLCIAGLNFEGNAFFSEEEKKNKNNIAVFEFIPYILSRCKNTTAAEQMLEKINITAEQFNKNLPAAPLHWLIADKTKSITVECMKDGLHVHKNPVGVLTNNPPFDIQMHNLNNYMNLSSENPENTFSENLELTTYSRGMGAIGLPGDLSSQSRFVRASFIKMNSVSEKDENSSVSQFFHILASVNQPRGCCKVGENYEITVYSSCMNADKGIYYYTSYNNNQITAVNMHKENPDGSVLKKYPIVSTQQINYIN